MLGLRRLDAIGRYRRMGDELAAERLHECRRDPRRIPALALDVAEHGIRAVQGKPALAGLHVVTQPLGTRIVGQDVDRVGHQEVAGLDRRDVAKVLRDMGADLLVLQQQLQELDTGEVHVVVLAAADEVGALA